MGASCISASVWPSGSLKKAIQRSWSSMRAIRCGLPVKARPEVESNSAGFFENDTRQAAHRKAAAWLEEHKDDKVKRYEVKDWQALFDGQTTKHWKIEGQVSVEDRILKIGGDQGGSIVTSARFARGFARFSYRQAGEAKAKMTWRGEEYAFSPARQGWTSSAYEPDAAGESPIRIVAPPGTTLLIQEFAFRPY